MPVQIANPTVVSKIERLSRTIGAGKTAVVEAAVDRMLAQVITVDTSAFVAYGKGSGHPAGSNFGDIFAYATAKVRRLPLLFKGNDFAQTDITSALA